MPTPRCPYFRRCGGCAFQDIDYSSQIGSKSALLKSATGLNEIKIFSGDEYNYRNRMDFIFHERGLGLRKKGDWRTIIDIERCEISDEKINLLLSEVRQHFKGCDFFDPRKCLGTFRYAVIRTACSNPSASPSLSLETFQKLQSASSISFVLNSDSTRLQDAIEKIKLFAEKTSASNVAVAYVHSKTDISVSDDFFMVKGDDTLMQEYLGKRFFYSIQGFFQNNHAMADKMHEYCTGLLRNYDTKGSHLLDLYGGVGTFAIINAGLFKSALTAESVKQCTESAEKNIRENNISNCNALTLDARYINKLELSHPLFVIIDPPRSGMHPDTILHLNKIRPRVIIYVSCNPEQLRKDFPKFKDYDIRSAALFDLFPQTPHCEAVVELELKNNYYAQSSNDKMQE